MLRRRGRLEPWVLTVYGASLFFCATGWEIWLSYGLIDGEPVDARRAAALSAAIPHHLNWLVDSLADAGICLFGLLLVGCAYRFRLTPFLDWKWGAFILLFVWFVGQNALVELTLYQEQLAAGKRLSWAPLIPTGPWWNPILLNFDGRTLHFQTQLPWVLMTPLFYATTIACCRRWKEPR
ncbi:MAG: hypothetical protein JRH16_07265 [Deltaproteobacteria bacterium]|nr:hypothetical protein [Deltaproteobacteria bacterium]MBW2360002.1 hypothetical protein [Deltaproteobacteria bacterium]